MTDLSPEEKQKIYAEEKARIEAQDKIKAEAKDKTTKEKKRQSIGCGIGCLTLIIIFILIGIFGTEDKTPTTKPSVTKPQGDITLMLKRLVAEFKNPKGQENKQLTLDVIYKFIVSIELIKDKQMRKTLYDYTIELLRDENKHIRAKVALALRDTTGQDFGEDYDKWLEWWSEKTVSKSEQKDVVEVAKQNFLSVAKKMGGKDPILVQSVVASVESTHPEALIPWWDFDEDMLEATPETQKAYKAYRSCVQKARK